MSGLEISKVWVVCEFCGKANLFTNQVCNNCGGILKLEYRIHVMPNDNIIESKLTPEIIERLKALVLKDEENEYDESEYEEREYEESIPEEITIDKQYYSEPEYSVPLWEIDETELIKRRKENEEKIVRAIFDNRKYHSDSIKYGFNRRICIGSITLGTIILGTLLTLGIFTKMITIPIINEPSFTFSTEVIKSLSSAIMLLFPIVIILVLMSRIKNML